MTTKQKGAYYEKKTIEYLKKIGYTHFERAYAKTVWIHGSPISLHHDFFGCVDIIALGPESQAYVQVKFEGENTGL
jgi:Holliday junction resolvase-like predicted endonuclease